MIELDSRLEEKIKGTKIVHCGRGLTYKDLCELYEDYCDCGHIITNSYLSNERFSWDCISDDVDSEYVYITFQDDSPLPLWLIESDKFEVEFYVGETE